VPSLLSRIQHYIPAEVAFVCKFWLENLNLASHEADPLDDALLEFCKNKILRWIEVYSILGCLPYVVAGLRGIHSWFSVRRYYLLLGDWH
jgi:hypothetical protein